MLSIKNNVITLTRGDTCVIRVDVSDIGDNDYTMQESDELIFTLRKKVGSREVLIEKTLEENLLKLQPEDTLDLDFGDYVFDIVLKTFAGEVFTVIPASTFKIAVEVHT